MSPELSTYFGDEPIASAELVEYIEGGLPTPRHLKLVPGFVVVEETGAQSALLEDPEMVLLETLFANTDTLLTVSELLAIMGLRYRHGLTRYNQKRKTGVGTEDLAYLAGGARVPYFDNHFLKFSNPPAPALYVLTVQPKSSREYIGNLLDQRAQANNSVGADSIRKKYEKEGIAADFKGRNTRKTWQGHTAGSLQSSPVSRQVYRDATDRIPPASPLAPQPILVFKPNPEAKPELPTTATAIVRMMLEADEGASFLHNKLIMQCDIDERPTLTSLLRKLGHNGYVVKHAGSAKFEDQSVTYQRTDTGKKTESKAEPNPIKEP